MQFLPITRRAQAVVGEASSLHCIRSFEALLISEETLKSTGSFSSFSVAYFGWSCAVAMFVFFGLPLAIVLVVTYILLFSQSKKSEDNSNLIPKKQSNMISKNHMSAFTVCIIMFSGFVVSINNLSWETTTPPSGKGCHLTQPPRNQSRMGRLYHKPDTTDPT